MTSILNQVKQLYTVIDIEDDRKPAVEVWAYERDHALYLARPQLGGLGVLLRATLSPTQPQQQENER